MTNQLEDQLKAITYTLAVKQHNKNNQELTTSQRIKLNEDITLLKQEKTRILKELGIKGDLL